MKKILNLFNPLKSPFAIIFYITVAVFFAHYVMTSSNIYGGFLGFVEKSLEQAKYELRGIKKVSNTVLIVDMDDATLEKYGWPINRKHFAKLVEKLDNGGAKSIAFDVIFADANNNDAIVSAKQFYKKFNKISLHNQGEISSKLEEFISDVEKNIDKIKKRLDETNKKISYRVYKRKKENKDRKPKDVIKPTKLETYTIKRLYKDRDFLQEKLTNSLEKIEKYRIYYQQLKDLNKEYSNYLHSKATELLPDKIFAQAIYKAKNVVLGYVGIATQTEVEMISKKRRDKNFDAIIARSNLKGIANLDLKKHTFFIEFPALNAPHPDIVWLKPAMSPEDIKKIEKKIEESGDNIDPELLDLLDKTGGILSTQHYGSFNLIPDIDGIARNYYPVYQIKDSKGDPNLIFSLGLAALKVYYHDKNKEIDDFLLKSQSGDINVPETGYVFDFSGKKQLFMEYYARMVVLNYYGPEKTFKYYSMKDILNGDVDMTEFKDKIVLIGTSATGLLDMRSSPYNPSQRYPGVEVHATFIENVIQDDYFQRPSFIPIIEFLFIIIIGFLVGFLLYKVKLYIGFFLAILLGATIFYIDFSLFFNNNLLLYSFNHILLPAYIFIGLTIFRYFSEEREKRKIKGAFKFYLSKSVVDEVLKDPNKLSLGGVKKDLSVLFSDIRGFTTISEGLTPEELSLLLNDYLTPMTNIVFKYEGTLDKYMGDAVMAFFGAPIDQADHAYKACMTAIDMMSELKILQGELQEKNLPLIDIGIGINSGEMSVGNMGSKQRFDYTVMGDNVNLGSRLEGINKQYKTNIIVSEYTFDKVKDSMLCRKLDAVRVKGKKLPVVIYELIGNNLEDPLWSKISKYFDNGIELYHARRWDQAIDIFENVLKLKKNDYPAKMYIERCNHYKENPPEEGWDGAFTMTTK